MDATDAMTFIGSKNFISKMSKDELIDRGKAFDGIGFVNRELNESDASNYGINSAKWVARSSIHEGLGHPECGSGHSDGDYVGDLFVTPRRYNQDYGGINRKNYLPNIMTSGEGTSFGDNRTSIFYQKS
ncbi:MAG: hypothetical protein IPJ06_15430 [Saprospiraceae bacterium]|nr:hypothetical protein [Saprospiraceae bacterium]